MKVVFGGRGDSVKFILKSAGVLAATGDSPESQMTPEQIAKKLNTKTHELQLPKGSRKNILGNAGMEYIWQLLERYSTEEEFIQHRINQLGAQPKLNIIQAIKALGLSFGMKFPEGFVGKTDNPFNSL